MTDQALATVAFKTLALWFFASGVAGLSSGLLTWSRDSAQFGAAVAATQLAANALFVPVGALLWLVGDTLAARVFAQAAPLRTDPSRSDLFAFAFVLVGLFLVTNALSQVVYWVVVWRISRGTGFWGAASQMTDERSIVYWVSARATMGVVAANLFMGALFLAGPRRLATILRRVRKELVGSFDEPAA